MTARDRSGWTTPWPPRPATLRAPSCATARRGSIATWARAATPAFATPDGRPGAIVQFHVPRFRKDRVGRWSVRCWSRISQNVLTCPTAACFNLLDTEPYFKLGRKIAFFGDGYQFRDVSVRPPRVGRADPGRRVCRSTGGSGSATA